MTTSDILLFGKPGAGKGTLSKDLLKSDTAFIHLSTGEVFRNHVDKATDLGIEIQHVLESGEFINDELTIAVVENFIMQTPRSKNIIFDGFPRNDAQMIWLLNFYNDNDLVAPVFVELDASDDICIQRIHSRALIEHRSDDADGKIIKKRFKDFYEKTASLKEIFTRYNEDNAISLDANGTSHDVLLQYYKKQSAL